MNNAINFNDYNHNKELKSKYKTMFIDKYLFVFNNINVIYNICSNNRIFYQVLESILLEDKEIYETYGYKYLKIIFDRYGYSNNSIVNLNDSLRGLISYILTEKDSHNRSLKCYVIERYLDLNGQVDNYDCTCDMKINFERIDTGVLYNEFIRGSSFLTINDDLVDQVFERINKDEDKKY